MVKEQGGWSQQERMNKGWPLQTNVINATTLIQTYSSSSDGLSVEGAVPAASKQRFCCMPCCLFLLINVLLLLGALKLLFLLA